MTVLVTITTTEAAKTSKLSILNNRLVFTKVLDDIAILTNDNMIIAFGFSPESDFPFSTYINMYVGVFI